MTLSDQLGEMWEQIGIPQRVVAAALGIDTTTYCEMGKGALMPQRNYIPILTSLCRIDEEWLLDDWLAEEITTFAMTKKK